MKPIYRQSELHESTVQLLAPAKYFEPNEKEVNSISYTSDGFQMISSTEDDSIHLYDIKTGVRTRSVNSKKYGVNHIQFASGATCAVHSSTKVDHTIRYLSLNDNKYLRYFQGHTEKVTGISVSPVDELFLSSSNDKTIRLWDLRTHNCMGIMNVYSSAIAKFDPDGLIFAAGMNSEVLKLYDLRSFEKGPFASFTFNKENYDWVSMKFSPCGKRILINTNGSSFLIIDSFSGEILQTLEGHQNVDRVALHGSFSADSKFIFQGSSDRHIYVWRIDTGEIHVKFDAAHEETPKHVEFNPKYFTLASACRKMVLWCPTTDVTVTQKTGLNKVSSFS